MSTPFQILLVDDDDGYLSLVRVVLRRLEQDVALHRLKDGDELPAHIEAAVRGDAPWPQLILLDQRMPRVDGTQALATLKTHPYGRAIPVCMMSSSDQDHFVSEAYRNGAAFCITKPLEFAELQNTLTRVLAFWSDVAQRPPSRPPPQA